MAAKSFCLPSSFSFHFTQLLLKSSHYGMEKMMFSLNKWKRESSLEQQQQKKLLLRFILILMKVIHGRESYSEFTALKGCVEPGVSAVAQLDQQCLWSTRTQVKSPAQHTGLRICHGHICSVGCNSGSLAQKLQMLVGQPKNKESKIRYSTIQ